MLGRLVGYLGILFAAVIVTLLARWLFKRTADPLHSRRLSHCETTWLPRIAMLSLLMLFVASLPARADGFQPNFWQAVSNWNSVDINSNGAVVYLNPATNTPITIKQNTGHSFLLSVSTTNNSSGTVYVFYGVNVDGNTNNWTSSNAPAFIQSFTFSGSNVTPGLFGWSNVPPAVLNNARSVFPYMASNTCTTNHIKLSIEESHGNQ